MRTDSQKTSILYLFSCALTFCIFLLIIAGGLVTSKEAGLSVPDWPLSYGKMFPPMVGNIFWEHGHRMIAGIVGILTLVFMITVHCLETRPWVKVLSRWMMGAVLLQALLGGLTVLLLLPPAVSIFHATLAQGFFCLAIAMTYFQSVKQGTDQHLRPVPCFTPGLERLTLITTVLIFIQLILGASVRHTKPTFFVVLHILMALIILIHVMLVMVRTFREASPVSPGLLKLAVGFGVISTFQVFLGMGAFIFKRVLERHSYAPGLGEVLFASAHQSVGALVLGVSVLLTLSVRAKRSQVVARDCRARLPARQVSAKARDSQ
ncbi:MAG: hypothetical protein EXS63_07990 [Candidatus Omnitrophica bacterium]|nr:hypothetical protein [Candidatus Omnitrophota bacterium]